PATCYLLPATCYLLPATCYLLPATVKEIKPLGNWVIGVDLGATKIALGLLDPENRIVARRRIPTQAKNGVQSVVERIAQSTAELTAQLPAGQRLAALGICSPGPVDHITGALLDPPNMPALHHAPLQRLLTARLNLPVKLEHDAKAAALGEFYYGAGRGAQSMVYLVVGTGVGGAIIIDGHLYRGVRNFAGEIGHTTIDRNGPICSCGSRGCVETYISGPWLVRHYTAAHERWAGPGSEGSVVSQYQPATGNGHGQGGHSLSQSSRQASLTGEEIAKRAAQGDVVAVDVLSNAGEALGTAVATLAMILNIDLYVVGGSVAKAGDLLLNPARRAVPGYSYQSVSSHVRIVAGELGNDGPIIGCGWLARQAIE
ncbi:MAG: ROK family protein, partial [Chloroflexota bacterium]|nr:ROK family protein [Chloroflexota bacterium]